MRRPARYRVIMIVFAVVGTFLTPTAASGATRTLTFGANADTTIRSDRPTRSYGTTSTLSVDNSPVQHTLLRFTVAGVGSDVVTGVTLSLYVTNPSPVAGIVYRVGSQSWPESVTWSTAPVADPVPITSGAKATQNAWMAFDLAALVVGDGTYSVRITSSSADGAEYTSREGGATQRPRIVVMTAPPQDVTPPSVSITSPNVGATVAGTTLIAATAGDDVGVTSVDMTIDGAVIGTDATKPYGAMWDTLPIGNGLHRLNAIAHDAAGHTTTSAPVEVAVANAIDTSPPSTPGDLTATVDGPTRITLAWTMSTDDVGVTAYEVQRGGGVIMAPRPHPDWSIRW